MKLCFSSYAQIMKKSCYNTVTNKALFHALVNSIDPNADYSDNDTQISRMFKGLTNFPVTGAKTQGKRKNDQPLTDIVNLARKIDICDADYLSSFEHNVSPLIDPDKQDTLLESLVTIVKHDSSIKPHNMAFKSCTGYSTDEIGVLAKAKPFCLLAGLFLYIAIMNDNSKEETDYDQIYNDYIRDFIDIPEIPVETSVEKYLKSVINEYNEIRTLLYSEAPVPFYDFYVQNNLNRRVKNYFGSYNDDYYGRKNVTELRKISPFVIISGTGGLGKSMMMRHFLLSSANEYQQTQIIPLFVRLKNYDTHYKDVVDFIQEEISPLWPNISVAELSTYLDEGRMLILLDGLDEINNTLSNAFQNNFSKFISRYPKNQYILSSRPYSNFSAFSRFTIFTLCPFTKQQGLELIDKLHFREDNPEIKQKFRKEFDKKLFYSHLGFSDNPLLLTIMLMTYEEFAEVPSKMHLFYQEAYTVMSKKHDASKGGYKRALETGVSVDDFADIFARFCATTYKDQKYEFSWFEMDSYYRSLKDKYFSLREKSVSDFITDVCNNLCLMYIDGDKYSFVHRSFQEYFCARYFASQKDKNLDKIGIMMDQNKLSQQTDKVLRMLYEMIPEKVIEYLIVPYMKRLIEKCESEDGYHTFLKTIYNNVEMGDEEMITEVYLSPDSPIYELIQDVYHITHDYIDADRVTDADMLSSVQYYMLTELSVAETVSEDDIPDNYVELYGDPPECGKVYVFDWDEIFSDDSYANLIESISTPDFPLYKEYMDFMELYDELVTKIECKSVGDLFDILD